MRPVFARRILLRSFVLVTIGFALTPQYGAAQQTVIDRIENLEVGFAYIPDRTFEITGRIDITQRGDETRDFFITLDGGGSGDTGRRVAVNSADPSDQLEYQLLSASSGEIVRSFDNDNPSAAEVLSGTIPGSTANPPFTTVSVELILRVEEGQLESPQPEYEDELVLNFYYGNINDPESFDADNPEEVETFVVSGNVEPFVQVALVAPGAGFPSGRFGDDRRTEREMDFGIMTAGVTRAWDLLVDSNTLFSVSASSTEGGVLRYTGGDPGSSDLPTEVPYEFRINGTPVLFDGDETLFATESFRLRWELVAEILEFGVPVAGEYEDVISITVSADE